MTKNQKRWIIGWTIFCLVAALFLIFKRATYPMELVGQCTAFNFSQLKGDIILEDGKDTFSMAHASQIMVRELDTVFAGSDYNVHFQAKTIRFKEIRITSGAQIRISALENTLVLSMSNVELGTQFQLTGFQSISVRDNAKDTVIQISKRVPFETASVSAKRSAIDYQTSLYFNDGYVLRITNLHGSALDFGQSVPGAGYQNSLNYLGILGETDKHYRAISSYGISFKCIDELEIQCQHGSIHFKILGRIKKLRINGIDTGKSLYDYYIEPSGWAKLLGIFAWVFPYIIPFVFKHKP